MNLLTVVGARPQFIKAAVISRALSTGAAPTIHERLIHTGQHFDANMSDIFFEELEIPPPAFSLGIEGGAHGKATGNMMARLEDVLSAEKPDAVLVYGDTNSTLAGALAAVKLCIPTVHVEAGLRSFNRRMPEEINRVMTDHAASLLYCPSATARDNLKREGITDNVVVSGDVMYDSVRFFAGKAPVPDHAPDEDFALMTLHRADNTDDAETLRSLIDGAASCGMPVVFPAHPRTAKALDAHDISLPSSITVIKPLGYLQLIAHVKAAAVVITDSGGLQKEAYFLGRPCVTIRTETEWTELVEIGANILAGHDGQPSVAEAVQRVRGRRIADRELYGEGKSGELIVRDIEEKWRKGMLTL